SSLRISRRNDDFPEPDAPTRKTNSPLRISRVTLLSAGRVLPAYDFDTASNLIIAAHRTCGSAQLPAATRTCVAFPASRAAHSRRRLPRWQPPEIRASGDLA